MKTNTTRPCLGIKQYDSTVEVGIGAIVAPAAKNAASKNHAKDILCDKNHLYGIVLVHITLNVAFKTENIFRWLNIIMDSTLCS